MSKTSLFVILILFPVLTLAQVIVKPIGCFAGTNGINENVLSHPDVRGVLLIEKWADIESSPGVFDFTVLNRKIDMVKAAGLKYSLAVAGGAFGSPSWLIDDLHVAHHTFQYNMQDWRLPLWWDPLCMEQLLALITELGEQYAADSMLSHVYVTQMTTNGVEGHLNGVDLTDLRHEGYTSQKWITNASLTARAFANAFSDKAIVFEVHEIDHDTIVPATIMNDLTSDPSLCQRVGLGMWWLSGKTNYQSDLIDYIKTFKGDKYAQVIGRSDELDRFNDSLYASVFIQAKDLNIRYIEPWPFEFQHHTHDSLMQDFNAWADSNFSTADTCLLGTPNKELQFLGELGMYPNPTTGRVSFKLDFSYHKLEVAVFNLNGTCVLSAHNQTEIDISQLPKGIYFVALKVDDVRMDKKLVKVE